MKNGHLLWPMKKLRLNVVTLIIFLRAQNMANLSHSRPQAAVPPPAMLFFPRLPANLTHLSVRSQYHPSVESSPFSCNSTPRLLHSTYLNHLLDLSTNLCLAPPVHTVHSVRTGMMICWSMYSQSLVPVCQPRVLRGMAIGTPSQAHIRQKGPRQSHKQRFPSSPRTK